MISIASRAACLLIAGLICVGSGAGSIELPIAIGSSSTLQVSVSATPSYGTAPLEVAFQATVASGVPTGYNWTFGDGTYYNGTNVSASAPTHFYPYPGRVDVSVTVFEGLESGTASIEVHAVASALSADIHTSVVRGRAPLTVAFSSIVSGGTGTYINYSWSFGDGGSGSGSSIQYTYTRMGTFHAVLTVWDSGSASTTAGTWINVTEVAAQNLWATVGVLAPWVILGLAVGIVAAWSSSRLRGGQWRIRTGPPTGQADTRTTENIVPPAGRPEPPVTRPELPTNISKSNTGSPPVSAESLLVSQRIILHLNGLGRLGSEEVAPAGFTQGGMAEALEIHQNSLTNVLRRLVAAGILEEDTRHVIGRNRRLKVYHFTNRGEGLAKELRQRTRPK